MADSRSYFDLLRDPQWQRKRLEIMERADFCCEECNSDSETLNVHHSYYEKGKKPWEYPSESLHCLCEDCHKGAEEVRRALNRQLGKISLSDIRQLLGFAYGLEMAEYPSAEHEARNYDTATGMCCAYATYGQNRREFIQRIDLLVRLLNAGDCVVDGYTLDFCTNPEIANRAEVGNVV